MVINVAINGFGRIGRCVLRAGINDRRINFVAINDLTDTKTLAHLLKYDSVYGKFPANVGFTEDCLIIGKKKIKVFSEKDPKNLPWKKLRIGVVVESTGFFTDRLSSGKHLKAGAKKVLISAIGKNPDLTIIKGVNEHLYDKKKHHIISMASCTTNSLAPMVKVLNDTFGIEKGFMTTVHALTSDQRLIDAPHSDLRRARAAVCNIIPTTTGAARAVVEVIPELKGKLDGMAMRVPMVCGSITDFVAVLKRQASVEEINNVFKQLSKTKLKGILEYSEEPLVSSDIIRNKNSVIFDSLSTKVIGNLVKVVGWYDNELGYSYRLIDVIKLMV